MPNTDRSTRLTVVGAKVKKLSDVSTTPITAAAMGKKSAIVAVGVGSDSEGHTFYPERSGTT